MQAIRFFLFLVFPQMSGAVVEASLSPDPPTVGGHMFKRDTEPNLDHF